MNHEKKQLKKYLIVGLGNPGKEFQDTPHNVGWVVISDIAGEQNITLEQTKPLFGEMAKFDKGKTEVILLLPTTYMNKSGLAVKSALKWWKVPLRNLLVVQDDSDLILGRLKIGYNQSAGGHKGVESIIQALKSQEFARLRLGIRPQSLPQGGKKHVKAEKFILRRLPDNWQKDIAKTAKEAAYYWLEEGLGKAMSKYNAKN